MKCPNCKKEQHWVCGRRDCRCYSDIPEGEKHLIYICMFRGIRIPKWIFNFMWHHIKRPVDFGLYELEKCSYCGYSDLPDNWFEIELMESN
jgi:hypothetical protein